MSGVSAEEEDGGPVPGLAGAVRMPCLVLHHLPRPQGGYAKTQVETRAPGSGPFRKGLEGPRAQAARPSARWGVSVARGGWSEVVRSDLARGLP